MKIIISFLSILILLTAMTSCDLMEHLQHMDPPEIKSVSPSEELINSGDWEAVSLSFSSEMNRKYTENAFSLEEDEEDMEGVFQWHGNVMSFTPYQGIKADKEYLITLKKSAEDNWGNSLDRDWYHLFYTGEDRTPPVLLGSLPVDDSLITNPRTPIILQFSEAPDQESFRNSLTLSPDLMLEHTWNVDGSQITLTPLEDYAEGENYRLTLSTDLCDHAGNCLPEKILLLFRIGELVDLELIDISETKTGTTLITDTTGVNTGLEKNSTIQGTFNRSLSYDERTTFYKFLPVPDIELSWNGDNTVFTMTFPEYLSYGIYYDLSILEELYVLYIDGEESLPIQIQNVTFCPEAGAAVPVLTPLSLNSSMEAVDSSDAFMDFYLKHAASSVINLYEFMTALSLDSSVLAFDPISLEWFDGSQIPAPEPLPAEGESLLRLHMGITDYGLAGTVSLSLAETLRDSLDNSLEEKWTLTVSQP